jgi:hypothetical protein
MCVRPLWLVDYFNDAVFTTHVIQIRKTGTKLMYVWLSVNDDKAISRVYFSKRAVPIRSEFWWAS